jgi:DnaJ-class molecular chaperone|tara:strand:- start:242 stop:409 length:168 start_codon:yes stop_codon:yes gene_type:complete
MEDTKIAFRANILTKNSIPCFKVICSKCAGAGNFKTPENLRRTCLECFGKGFINV